MPWEHGSWVPRCYFVIFDLCCFLSGTQVIWAKQSRLGHERKFEPWSYVGAVFLISLHQIFTTEELMVLHWFPAIYRYLIESYIGLQWTFKLELIIFLRTSWRNKEILLSWRLEHFSIAHYFFWESRFPQRLVHLEFWYKVLSFSIIRFRSNDFLLRLLEASLCLHTSTSSFFFWPFQLFSVTPSSATKEN